MLYECCFPCGVLTQQHDHWLRIKITASLFEKKSLLVYKYDILKKHGVEASINCRTEQISHIIFCNTKILLKL
jgi:hypothetical protein